VRPRARHLAVAFAIALAAPARAGTPQLLRLPPGSRGATFDQKSFLFDGQPGLLLAGGVHYFRIHPDEWPDRLAQTRLAGFNTVDVPVPWNLHEPARGSFRFDGIANLGGFLDLCHRHKLRVLLRIGPYVNAALSNGGLPAWLGDRPECRVRSTSSEFLAAVKAWWRRLFAVVLPRQAPGGPVVMVQIEDGYKGLQRGYLARLYEEAEGMGVKVPVVLSGLSPCKDFAGLRVPDNSLFATTALEPVAPCQWGDTPRRCPRFDDVLFEGFAKGIDGYSLRAWAAGTHLAVLQASAFPTRYESGTMGLTEGGGYTELHAACRKANFFARAFEPVLARANAARAHPLLAQAQRKGLVAYGRTDGTTTLLFVKRRYGAGTLALHSKALGLDAGLAVAEAPFRHVVLDHPLTADTRLAFSTAQVLAHQRFGRRQMLVVYTPVGSEMVMAFRTKRRPTLRAGAGQMSWDDRKKQLVLRWRCKDKKAKADFVFDADAPIHVVALAESLADDTWVLDGTGVLVGAPGVAGWTPGSSREVELLLPARRSRLDVSFYPAGQERSVPKTPGVASASYDAAARRIDFRVDYNASRPIPVALRQWETAAGFAEAAPDHDDAGWTATPRPKPLGEAPYGWYRCEFRAPRAGRESLQFRNVADAVTVFLNGAYVGTSPTKRLVDAQRNFQHPASFDVTVKSGPNVLAVLAKNWGRYRNTTSFDVQLGKTTGWGILGEVLLGPRPLLRWRQREGLAPKGRRLAWAADTDDARDTQPRWFRAEFPRRPHPARVVPRLVLKGMGHGAIWINGHFAGLYQQRGYDAGRGTYLPRAWLQKQNEIIVLEEEGSRRPTRAELNYDRRSSLIPLRIGFAP